jgi:NADPH-dependent glutamate synthase beta subunit-like oxidoreductase
MVEGRTYRPVIKTDKCKTCDICLRGCPAEFVPEYRQEEETLRGALYRKRISGSHFKNGIFVPPCQESCPIHQDTRSYVSLIAKERLKEAFELIREVNPLPAVCGYICHHPCEDACLRMEADQPVPLRLLKRFIAEYERENGIMLRKAKKKRREKILVIGSGPAGLAAANDLSLMGYGVTVVEALPVLGGMLAVGIPKFRLPRGILQKEIEGIEAMGVEMKKGNHFHLDGDRKAFKKLGFQAAFLSIGAHRGLRLNIPGEEFQGVLPGVKFLRKVNLGEEIKIGGKVAVVGGGNVAIDVARSALRLGARQVQLFCIESREEMPTIPGEVEESIQEGINIQPLVSPLRILGKGGKAIGMELIRLSSSRINEKGKIELVPIRGSNFKIEAGIIITAIGQKVERKSLDGLDINRNGTVRVDPDTGETSMKGVFAGGDAVTGPGWAIDAIAAGKKGARSIHEYLS